jgi:hypothetical protein
MRDADSSSGPVPALLLGVGLFLLAESLTFTCLALRPAHTFLVDYLDLAFVLAGALGIIVIGALEARRLRSRPGPLWSMGIAGAVIGIIAGYVAIWLGTLGR